MKTLLTIVLNIVGVFLIPILVTTLSGASTGITAEGSRINVDIKLDGGGLIATAVSVILYFVLSKKFWGKTVGGKIVSLLAGGK